MSGAGPRGAGGDHSVTCSAGAGHGLVCCLFGKCWALGLLACDAAALGIGDCLGLLCHLRGTWGPEEMMGTGSPGCRTEQ